VRLSAALPLPERGVVPGQWAGASTKARAATKRVEGPQAAAAGDDGSRGLALVAPDSPQQGEPCWGLRGTSRVLDDRVYLDLFGIGLHDRGRQSNLFLANIFSERVVIVGFQNIVSIWFAFFRFLLTGRCDVFHRFGF
jgi:hypothetical protein